MHRISLKTGLLQKRVKLVQYFKGINIRLQIVFNDRVECRFFGVHDHNGQIDPGFSQFNAFVSISNAQVVNFMVLKNPCNFRAAATISKCFYHGHHFRGGL